MKGKTQIFAVLFFLCTIFFVPQNSSAASQVSGKLLTPASEQIIFSDELEYERILNDGIWWIYVYDNGKIVDVYPEV